MTGIVNNTGGRSGIIGTIVGTPAIGTTGIDDNADATAMTIGSDESVTFVGSTIIPSIKQPSSKAVTGTYTSKEMLLADTYSLTGNATINSDVVLGSLTGSDVVLLSDSTSVARTITGSGTLEIGEMTAKTPSAANIIAGGLTADADIQKNVDAALDASGIKKNVVVGFAHGQNSVRNAAVPNTSNHILWYHAVKINKRYKDTHLHFKAMLPGHGKHCYPYYGTFGQVTLPAGQTHRRYDSSHYIITYHAAGAVQWWMDFVMTPAQCQYQSGAFWLDCGYDTITGSCRPFNTWNPNQADDSRGFQKTSSAYVTELYLGEGQGEDS